MEREILFRGFCPSKNGKQIITLDGEDIRGDWVYGDLIHNIDCVKVRERETDINRIAKSYEVIPETVGQFTGLTDKNGKKIFEGDYAILKDSKGQMRLKCVYVDALCGYFWERSIYLDKRGWWFDRLDKFESYRNIAYIVFNTGKYIAAEIIGNIHDKED